MSKPSQENGKRTGPGRPPKPADEKYHKCFVSISPADHDYLIALGGGSLSAGIRLAAARSREKKSKKT